MLKPGDKLYHYSHNSHKIESYTFVREGFNGRWILTTDDTKREFPYNPFETYSQFYPNIKEANQQALRYLQSRLPFAERNLKDAQRGLDSSLAEIAKLEADIDAEAR